MEEARLKKVHEAFYNLIASINGDISKILNKFEAERKKKDLLHLCFQEIPGFEDYYKDRINEDGIILK